METTAERPMARAAAGLRVEWLGRVPYGDALEIQRRRVEARRRGACGDSLLLLEHPPVVTLGRRARPENLLVPREVLEARGVEVHEVSRGGDVTWHGPGQLVGYLVLDLQARGAPDVHAHLRTIEALLIDALCGLGLSAGRRAGMTGVFVEASRPPRKIASIGVGLRGWTTFHGFALNVCNRPEGFAEIVPCGLRGVTMTSLREELAEPGEEGALWAQARERVAESARRVLAGSGSVDLARNGSADLARTGAIG